MSLLERTAEFLIKNDLKLSVVESCTGGLLSSKFTDIPGSSAYTTFNLVTYSNQSKHELLKVDNSILRNFGAVSEECAYYMAKGLYDLSLSDICISTTGIAGPGGGSIEKPVGLMYSTIFTTKNFQNYKISLSPDIPRIEMKEYFVDEVINNLAKYLGI